MTFDMASWEVSSRQQRSQATTTPIHSGPFRPPTRKGKNKCAFPNVLVRKFIEKVRLATESPVCDGVGARVQNTYAAGGAKGTVLERLD